MTAQDPLANSHTAAGSADITATYDEPINAASATPQNFVVRSEMSANAISVSATGNTITADPANDFFAGDQIQVTSTTGVQGTTVGVKNVWQFRTRVLSGSGIFADTGQSTLSVGTQFVTLADVDGDGDVDAMEGSSGAIALNDGSAVFTDSGQRVPVGNENEFGDVDGDGDLDVVGTSGVWLNNGSGVFSNTNQALGGGLSIELGDLDGDGDLDAMRGVAYTVNRVLFNDGNGVFTDSGQGLGNASSQSIEFADFDGDGDLDAFSANNGAPNRIWVNDGNGVFTGNGQALGTFSTTIDVDLGDLDGDGDIDAIEANNPQGNIGSRVWLNNGSGLFTDTGQNLGPNENNWGIEVGDVDNDGDLDAVVSNLGQPGGRVWLNNGSAGFSDSGQAITHPGGISFYGVDIADLDGDGDLDAWFAANSQISRVWINQNLSPDVTLAVDDTTITENPGTATITATIAAVHTADIIVDLGFTGNATSGDDYTSSGNQITIATGATSGSISVTAVQDALDEPDETLVVDVTGISNGQEAGGSQQVTITIIDDDDPPTVDLSVDSGNIGETGGVATATATLSAASGQDVTVTLAAGGTATSGTDYNLSAAQIVIAAGATTGTATVSSIDDAIDEPDETVDLTMTAANATVGVGAQSVTITDDDDPPTVTLTVDTTSVAENGGLASFTATLSAAALAAVTVDLGVAGSSTATPTTDYTLSGTQIVIAAGDTSGSVTVTSVADVLITEGPETVTLEITAVSANASEAGEQIATTTIIDDVNGPDVTLAIDNATIGENGGTATVTATLATAFGLPVTVDLGFSGAATQGTDYAVSTTQISVPVGATTGTAVITASQDTLIEGDEPVVVDIAAVTNGNEAGGQQQVATTITDDEAPPTVTLSASAASIAEAGGAATVTATLSAASEQEVTVSLGISGSATPTADYTVSGAAIVIAAGSTTGTMTVTAVQDVQDDDDETVIVDITGVTNGTEDGTQQVTVTIVDDDDAPLLPPGPTPPNATIDAPRATTVNYTFGQNVNAANVNDGTFVVHSLQSGQLVGGKTTVTAAGPSVTHTPANNFFAGERVHATATAAIGAGPKAVWTFHAAVGGGLGTFSSSGQTLGDVTANIASYGVGAGDFDGDGDLDLFFANGNNTPVARNANTVWLNQGAGVFTDSGQLLGDHFSREMALGDVDGDGDLDAVVANQGQPNRVWLNNGSAVFTSTTFGGNTSWDVSLGDLDGDGDLDAFVANTNTGDGVYLNNGSGTFSGGATVGNLDTRGVALGDVDGDGDLDAFAAVQNAGTSPLPNRVWLNNGSAVFTDAGQGLGLGPSHGVALGDLDGDGDLDAAVANRDGFDTVFVNNGAGVFTDTGQQLDPVVSYSRTEDIGLGDVDNDGDLDILTSSQLNRPNILWINNGSGGFTEAQSVSNTPGLNTNAFAFADIDGDADIDIVEATGNNGLNPQNAVNLVWTNDNPAINVAISVDDTTITENPGTSSITATVTGTATQDIVVSLDFSGTATGGGTDYTATASAITVPVGSSTGSISVTAVQDTLDEPDETIVIDISGVSGGAGGSGRVTITVIDDDDPPTVDLSVDSGNIGENGGVATATATLSTVSGQDVTVDVAAGGTATGGTDYNLAGTPIVIAAGSTSGVATVTAVDDLFDEPDETVDLTITATNATVGVGAQGVTITDDDDPPTVTLTVDDTSIDEDGGVASFTATLSAAAAAAVTVDLAVAGTSTATATTDYTLSGTQIVIAAGATSGSVTVTSVADLLITEGPETVTLEITGVSANASEAGEQTATTTIIDDVNGPDVTLSIDAANVAENGGQATVTATLATAFSLPVTIDLGYTGSATQGTDYAASSNQISIAAGSTTGTVTILAQDDVLFEGNEDVVVDIVNVINGNEASPQQVTTTITDDDDPPTVTLSVDNTAIAEAGGLATFTGTLSAASGQDVTVDLALSGTATATADYTISSSQIVIGAGATTGSVVVTAVQDTVDDNGETVVVDIASVTGAVENGTQQQTTTITDDDDPEVALSVDASTIAEAAGVASFTATLSSAAAAVVTIDLAFSGTATPVTDYTTSGTQITIPVGATSGTIVVTAVQDEETEPNETVIAEVSSVTNAREVDPQMATTTIEDDEGPPVVTLDIDAETIAEAGGVARVTATLSKTSDLPVTVVLVFSGTAAANDYTASDTQITIPAGSTSGSVTITGVDDNRTEGDQTVIVDIDTATNGVEDGVQQVTTTITDDEPQPSVSLLLLSSQTMPENGGRTQIAAFLTRTTESPVVIDLAFAGDATFDEDYTGPTQIIINPGALNSFNNFFTSINDTVDEPNETVVINVANVTGAGGGGSVTVTIIDDDVVPEVSISILDPTSFLEAIGSTTVRVALSTPALAPVTVDVGYAGGSATLGDDFNAQTQFTIPVGGSIAVGALNSIADTLDEDDEVILAEITGATNATIGTSQARATIVDDDNPPTVSIAVNSTEISEGGVASLTATLSTASGRDVILDLGYAGTATAGTDHTAPAQITVPAGSLSGLVELMAVQDPLDEPDETVEVNVTGITNATAAGTQQVTLTILDDDEPVTPDVTLSATPAEIAEMAGLSTFTATLSQATSVAVTVDLAVAASSTATETADYTVSGLQISIAPGSTSGSVTVTAVQDETFEPNETVTLEIANVTGGNELDQQSATTTILDDDLPPTFQVTSLTPTSGGFTARLSGGLDTSVLNLGDTESGGHGPADAVLSGASVGAIRGSLIVDPSGSVVTFLGTGGRLPADTYTVTLRSAENGFKDTAGNLLDGDANGAAGGDFSDSFTVAASTAIEVSVADFVRGPGQDLNLPASSSDGIPVSISDGTGVRNATFTIDYDANLLTITGVTPGASMPAGSTASVDTSTPGRAIVSFTGGADLPAGPNALVNLQAAVPATNASAIYGQQHVLDVNTISLTNASGAALPSVDNDGLHVAAFFADVSGNGRVNATDATQVARVATSLDSVFGNFLTTDFLIVGDVNESGRLNLIDAVDVARFSVLLPVDTIPPLPANVVISSASGGFLNAGSPEILIAAATPPAADGLPSPGQPAATEDVARYPAIDNLMTDLGGDTRDETDDEPLPVALEDAIDELLSAPE